MALQQEGVKRALLAVGWQLPIRTDDATAKARIAEIDTAPRSPSVAASARKSP
jgi:aspartokinase